MRRVVLAVICGATDWLESPLFAYRSDGNWWQRRVAAWAQVAWFHAHNNRLYRWADTDPGGHTGHTP